MKSSGSVCSADSRGNQRLQLYIARPLPVLRCDLWAGHDVASGPFIDLPNEQVGSIASATYPTREFDLEREREIGV